MSERPRTAAELAPARAFVDMSDVLRYLRFHTVVSGIQRVIAEVVPHLDEIIDCQFVTYSVERGEFVSLDRERILGMLEVVRHANELTKDRSRAEVELVLATVEGAPAHRGRLGDSLMILGAGWAQPGLFKAVQTLKGQGSAVVVLVYDLIPVLYPGFSEAMIHEFRQYVPRVAYLADRVPTISDATRRDFEDYCRAHGWPVPGGGTTRLAGDQWSEGRLSELGISEGPSWERPFALMVSTVESRKNHILAFRAWQRLLASQDPDTVPDLVCVGRLGWNVYEFLEEMHVTDGLGGRVHVLHESVSDATLASLYRDCLFTVYPSKYEGWGLPVAESLEWGKPVVSARNSSLPEVGLDLVTYFDDDDLEAFVGAVSSFITDPEARRSAAERIAQDYHPPTWSDVARVLADECRSAVRERRVPQFEAEVGVEYGLGTLPAFTGTVTGEAVVEFLDDRRRLPLTGQYLGVDGAFLAEMLTAVTRSFGSSRTTISFPRPTAEELHLVVATVEGPREWDIRVVEPRGAPERRLVAGEAFTVPLGSGRVGEIVRCVIHVRGSTDEALRSFVVSTSAAEADAMVSRNLVRLVNRRPTGGPRGDSQAAEALEMLMSSTSWRITKPLRDGKAIVARVRHRRRSRP